MSDGDYDPPAGIVTSHGVDKREPACLYLVGVESCKYPGKHCKRFCKRLHLEIKNLRAAVILTPRLFDEC